MLGDKRRAMPAGTAMRVVVGIAKHEVLAPVQQRKNRCHSIC
jgi:hypothetical protein